MQAQTATAADGHLPCFPYYYDTDTVKLLLTWHMYAALKNIFGILQTPTAAEVIFSPASIYIILTEHLLKRKISPK
jgi:hypothetical protein